jgi:hypothetical protein
VHPNFEVVNVSTRTGSISAISLPLSSGNIAPWQSTKKIHDPLSGERERDLGLSFDLLGDKERSREPIFVGDTALACCGGDMEYLSKSHVCNGYPHPCGDVDGHFTGIGDSPQLENDSP